MKRWIVTAERLDRSTVIKLDCGHERSIGGHVFHDGRKPIVGMSYDCRDGTCVRVA
jgi:hypothetical protein